MIRAAERITDRNELIDCDVESKAPISPKFRKVDLSKIAEIQYLKDKLTHVVYTGKYRGLPEQIIKVLGCENSYSTVIDDKYKILGACMDAFNLGVYACYVISDNKISLIHAPTAPVDKNYKIKIEDLEELEWDIDQL